MTIYLCQKGHKHESQDGATSCKYCKRNISGHSKHFDEIIAEIEKLSADAKRLLKKLSAFRG